MARLVSSGGSGGGGSPFDDLCLLKEEEGEDKSLAGRRRDNATSPTTIRSVDLFIVNDYRLGDRSSAGVDAMGGSHSISPATHYALQNGNERIMARNNYHQRRIKVAKVVNGHNAVNNNNHHNTNINNYNNNIIRNKEQDPHIYEDIEPNGPPKLAPVSGVLPKGVDVIRPIAFKPVVPNGGSVFGGGSRYPSLSSTPIGGLSYLSTSTSSLANSSSFQLRSGGPSRTASTTSTLLACDEPITDYYFENGDHSDAKSTSTTLTLSSGNRYLSQSSIASGKNGVGGSNGNFFLELDARSACTYSTDSCIKLSETPASYFSSSNLSRGSALQLDEDFNQTPSPSDSGVAELEAILKEKDSEINYLRETMEQNEQVIFKVYEEKELSWQRENKRLKAHYEAKLKACQQRAHKMEQMLMMQTYQLQQEKRKLKADCEKAKEEKDSVTTETDELRLELNTIRSQLEETEWTMCQKSGEISLLKSQLKDSQGDQNSRTTELLQLRSQLKESRTENEKKSVEARSLNEQVSSLCQELEELRHNRSNAIEAVLAKNRELLKEKERLELSNAELKRQAEHVMVDLENSRVKLMAQRETFEIEKVQWLEEKEKVIRYQKQLQLNYVQMYRRNRTLESEVEQLTLELEGRDLKLINGESEC